MKERPILFSGSMVRALLEGRKTKTRRVLKCDSEIVGTSTTREWAERLADNYPVRPTEKMISDKAALLEGKIHPLVLAGGSMVSLPCPYGKPGDRLWVRETTKEDIVGSRSLAIYEADYQHVCKSDGLPADWWYSRKVCPSIHMPRWASRILLEVVNVRVERLQDITEEDAIAEGVDPSIHEKTYRYGFSKLWEQINGSGSWDANPIVWVVEFKRIEP